MDKTLQEKFEILNSFRELEPGWDGYSAPAIDPGIIESVRKFLVDNFLLKGLAGDYFGDLTVVPTLSGGVQLEFIKGNRSLELEWVAPDKIEYLKVEENTTTPEACLDVLKSWI